MEKSQILSEIQTILCDILESDDITIQEDTNVSDVQGWNSLAHMSIIERIENTFNIKFSIGEIVIIKRISDLVNLIQTKIS